MALELRDDRVALAHAQAQRSRPSTRGRRHALARLADSCRRASWRSRRRAGVARGCELSVTAHG